MTKKVLVKVPQIEIDGESYHETAQVAYGVVNDTQITGDGSNTVHKGNFKVMKYVLVGNRVASETVVRESKLLAVALAECDIQLRKAMTKKKGKK